ncbi:hypothetical protein D3C85_1568830 [compost metagenome]
MQIDRAEILQPGRDGGIAVSVHLEPASGEERAGCVIEHQVLAGAEVNLATGGDGAVGVREAVHVHDSVGVRLDRAVVLEPRGR